MESTNTGEQVIDDETADVGGSTEIEKLMESLEIEVSLFVPSSCDVFEVCVLFTDAEQSYDGQSVKTLSLEWATERSEYISLLSDYKSRTERQARKVTFKHTLCSISIIAVLIINLPYVSGRTVRSLELRFAG